eukprot:47028-Hanusia_phi.AAC.1
MGAGCRELAGGGVTWNCLIGVQRGILRDAGVNMERWICRRQWKPAAPLVDQCMSKQLLAEWIGFHGFPRRLIFPTAMMICLALLSANVDKSWYSP